MTIQLIPDERIADRFRLQYTNGRYLGYTVKDKEGRMMFSAPIMNGDLYAYDLRAVADVLDELNEEL